MVKKPVAKRICNLTYPAEFEISLRKTAVDKKAMHTIGSLLFEQTSLFSLKSKNFSHLQHRSLLLIAITSNFTDNLDQQVSWALRTCFCCKRYDLANDRRQIYQILLACGMLDMKTTCYLWKKQNKKHLAFNGELGMPTDKVKVDTRTNQATQQLFAIKF